MAALRLWNNLPSEITTSNDTKMFKKELKTHLLANIRIVRLKNLICQQFIVKCLRCNVNIAGYAL